ncbi:MAG: HAD-IA family hydrolase [bacterium]
MILEEPVVNLLVALRKHYLIGVISNGPSRAQWEKITNIHGADFFDSILVSGDLTCEKPEPEIFHIACQQLNVLPEKSCMIGDRLETDVLGGKMAGLAATFWIPLNKSSEEPLVNQPDAPDFTLTNIMDLATIFGVNLATTQEIR